MAADDNLHAARDRSRKRRVLVAAILGAGAVFLDSSVANVALPAIQRDLGVSTATQQWIVSAYLLTLSVLLLVGGRLADIYGRKRLFVGGLVGYAVLAVLAGLAPNGTVLIAARGLQGAAGAMLVPTTLALINANYPTEERGRAIGQWVAWSGITTILGPLVGGFAIDNLSWRYAFLITPLLAVAALVVARPVPESSDRVCEKSVDLLGVALVVAALGGIVFALIQGPVAGWGATEVLVGAALGVVLLPVFLWWEVRAKSPLMPYGMFSSRNLIVANLVTFFVYAGLYGMFFYVPIYVQQALGRSATLSATVFIPITVLLFFLSPLAGRLNDRFGPRWLLFGGPLVAATGVVLAALTGQEGFWTLLIPGVLVFGIGLGFTVAPVTATAIGSAEERYSGVASGFNNAVSRVAGLLAIALMGVVVVQLWQGALAAAADGAAPEVRAALEAVSDRAFVVPSQGVPAEYAAEVQRLCERAAAQAFRNGMLLAAALVATGGIVSAVFIRSPDLRAEKDPADTPDTGAEKDPAEVV